MLRIAVLAVLNILSLSWAFAQDDLSIPDAPVWVTPGKIPSSQIYGEYCASCHGVSGKGDGPVARSLKTPPTDLTKLTATNKGKFPEFRVMQSIKAGPTISAHGTPAMPVWGPFFVNQGKAASISEMQLLIHNLTEYIRGMQTK